MRDRKGSLVGLLILGCAMLTGGCVRALSEGAAAGLSDGIAALIEDIIAAAAAGFRGN